MQTRTPTSIWDELQEEPIMEPTEAPVIRQGFAKRLWSSFYDRMGSLLLLNLAVSIQGVVGATVGFLLASILGASSGLGVAIIGLFTCLSLAPAVAGLYTYVRAICDEDALPSLADYLRGMRRYAVRSWILLLIQAGSGALLVLNIRFYATVHGVGGVAILLLVLMLALLWAMAGCYAWPLLVRDVSWRALLRNAILLALAAPFSTLAMLVGLGVLSAALIATRIGWVLFLFVAWALTENLALQRLVRIFRERQEAQAGASGAGSQE